MEARDGVVVLGADLFLNFLATISGEAVQEVRSVVLVLADRVQVLTPQLGDSALPKLVA